MRRSYPAEDVAYQYTKTSKLLWKQEDKSITHRDDKWLHYILRGANVELRCIATENLHCLMAVIERYFFKKKIAMLTKHDRVNVVLAGHSYFKQLVAHLP